MDEWVDSEGGEIALVNWREDVQDKWRQGRVPG